MTLSCSSTWTKRTYGPGIFVNQVEIADVQDISGEQLPYMEKSVDVGIKLILEIGREFKPEQIIAGIFKRDSASGEVIGWGSGWLVRDALNRLGYSGPLNEGNTIPADALQPLVGKRFNRLSYISGQKSNGKPRYSDWNQIATIEEGAESLVSRFKRSLAKGYPKNYRPQILDATTTILDTVPVSDDQAF